MPDQPPSKYRVTLNGHHYDLDAEAQRRAWLLLDVSRPCGTVLLTDRTTAERRTDLAEYLGVTSNLAQTIAIEFRAIAWPPPTPALAEQAYEPREDDEVTVTGTVKRMDGRLYVHAAAGVSIGPAGFSALIAGGHVTLVDRPDYYEPYEPGRVYRCDRGELWLFTAYEAYPRPWRRLLDGAMLGDPKRAPEPMDIVPAQEPDTRVWDVQTCHTFPPPSGPLDPHSELVTGRDALEDHLALAGVTESAYAARDEGETTAGDYSVSWSLVKP